MSRKRWYVLGIGIAFLALVIAAILTIGIGKAHMGIKKRAQAGVIAESPRGTKTYTHPLPGFSLEYPSELEVSEYDEKEGGETITFVNPRNASAGAVTDKIGFQIFIAPLGNGEQLTRERILEYLPKAVIEEPLRVVVNPSAPEDSRIQGLAFWSESQAIGRTRELWFTHNGYLYEITAYAHLDSWLAELVSSWRFR